MAIYNGIYYNLFKMRMLICFVQYFTGHGIIQKAKIIYHKGHKEHKDLKSTITSFVTLVHAL